MLHLTQTRLNVDAVHLLGATQSSTELHKRTRPASTRSPVAPNTIPRPILRPQRRIRIILNITLRCIRRQTTKIAHRQLTHSFSSYQHFRSGFTTKKPQSLNRPLNANKQIRVSCHDSTQTLLHEINGSRITYLVKIQIEAKRRPLTRHNASLPIKHQLQPSQFGQQRRSRPS